MVEFLGYSAGNGHRVLERLNERPIMSVNEVRELTGTTYPAANQLVERLVKIGILTEITGQARNRRFRYDDYVRLFDEPNAIGGLRHDRWIEDLSSDKGLWRAGARRCAGALGSVAEPGLCLLSAGSKTWATAARVSTRCRCHDQNRLTVRASVTTFSPASRPLTMDRTWLAQASSAKRFSAAQSCR